MESLFPFPDKTEMVQRRAARFVYNDYSSFSHVSPMIDTLGWDSLTHRRFVSQMCMFNKVYKGHVAISLPADSEMSPNTTELRAVATVHLSFHQLGTSNDIRKEIFFLS